MKIPFIILLGILSQNYVVAQSYFRTDYPAVWQRATHYTLEVAEAMPAHQYGFKPVDEIMSFQGQVVHLIQNLSYLSGLITGERPDFFVGENPELPAKEKITLALGKSLGYINDLIRTVDEKTLAERISFAGENVTKESIFYLMRDHMTHHRAQAILYLRMNAIEPPKYRGW
ncbi:DinB family protein [Telluribacter sp.]|jgi:uncharacterized damage-inducible protein DinB|uniref:DinB family protein n=1 Tax=Telluribacter sp. TaxID=1978767 RepID=UPI002E13B9CE|nr:DinB family protein [Telluribacter sp.]